MLSNEQDTSSKLAARVLIVVHSSGMFFQTTEEKYSYPKISYDDSQIGVTDFSTLLLPFLQPSTSDTPRFLHQSISLLSFVLHFGCWSLSHALLMSISIIISHMSCDKAFLSCRYYRSCSLWCHIIYSYYLFAFR